MKNYRPVLAKRGSEYAIREIRRYRDADMDRSIGKAHRYRIFSMDMNACAICRKPRAEHHE